MADRRAFLLQRQDHLRRAVICEPRGHDAVVGAIPTPPVEPGSAAGVVFFNNAGALGMCGHGLIGLVRTLSFLGRLGTGAVRIDTPVGTVGAELHADGRVTIENVPAFVHAADVVVEVPASAASWATWPGAETGSTSPRSGRRSWSSRTPRP
jgi:4-hydroxyproline epimerase